METIPINIWDDYYDDNHIPKGKKQETYIYVEDDEISLEARKKCLEEILTYIDNFHDFSETKMYMSFYNSKVKYPDMVDRIDFPHSERWEIRVENLTHKKREKLVDKLNEAELSFNGVPFRIYSES